MSGWIILDKSSGLFSRTASNRVARLFGIKKSGHIGTLDPMATGVLPIALGDATKMIPFVEQEQNGIKEYLFSCKFGFETDTLDVTGHETARDNIIPTDEQINKVLPDFIGDIQQIPPMYSAIHIDGKRAYKMARNGEQVDIPSRKICIYELKYLGKTDESWNFSVKCSTGTYVRSIARDIAKKCGALATVDMIRRTYTNGFDVKNAVTLDFLENLFNNGADIEKYLMPLDFGLGDIPVLNLDDKDTEFYKNGGFIKTTMPNGTFRVYNNHEFVGIGAVQNNQLRPRRTI
jgi:tRNA pseudouridine55 synthase